MITPMRHEPSPDSVRVTEIFYSIQGESTLAGRPCAFVRLTGCPLRCRWCDTAYAFTGGDRMTFDEIVDRLRSWDCPLVEVTGGEPLAQSACVALLSRLADEGWTVLLETSGAWPVEPVDRRVRIILDVKCPDSGEQGRNRLENLAHLKPQDEIKFVLASRRDYEWARAFVEAHGLRGRTILFSPVVSSLAPDALAGWILEDHLPVRIQLQLHKLLFGEGRQGV